MHFMKGGFKMENFIEPKEAKRLHAAQRSMFPCLPPQSAVYMTQSGFPELEMEFIRLP